MALPTDVFVDFSIDADSGTGVIGDPYGRPQYALDTEPQAAAGNIFNIKDSVPPNLPAALDFSTYGSPSASQPVGFRGYTSAADDGGIGDFNGGGSYGIIINTALDYVFFKDMHLHNTGVNHIVSLDDYISFVNCELDGTTALAADVDNYPRMINCYVHNCDGIVTRTSAYIAYNYFQYLTNQFTAAILVSSNSVITRNVIKMGNGNGFYGSANNIIEYNSIFSVSGTGKGISIGSGFGCIVRNNITEGFSGVGGNGISIGSGATLLHYGYNAFYNNTTNLSNSGDLIIDDSAQDQALGSSPFTDASNEDFRVDTSAKALAWPTSDYPSLPAGVRTYDDIGALQREEASGGGGVRNPLGGPI